MAEPARCPLGELLWAAPLLLRMADLGVDWRVTVVGGATAAEEARRLEATCAGSGREPLGPLHATRAGAFGGGGGAWARSVGMATRGGAPAGRAQSTAEVKRWSVSSMVKETSEGGEIHSRVMRWARMSCERMGG